MCVYFLQLVWIFVFDFFFFLFFRNAYRAEIASFLVPVSGETPATARIRERIEFNSNLLFLIEDLYLTVGPGYMVSQSSTKINVRSPLYWVRNQLAGKLKELMIAKKTGWQVLRNLKNQVNILLFFFLEICKEPSDGLENVVVLLENIEFNDLGFFILDISTDFSVFI